MARTNVPIQAAAPRTHEGAVASRIDDVALLRRSVMSCLLWEDEFYEEGERVANRIARLASMLDPSVVAGIAIEAREAMYLRHAPLWLVRAMAPNGGRIVGDTLARVIQRPDELAEFLALYWKDGRTPLAKQVKRGLAEAFGKFDAYQLAKYDRAGAVRLRDVLRLVHPVPRDAAQAELWRQLLAGELPAPDTWEVQLSAGGDRKDVFTRLLEERKLGGLALLRNLRNMTQAGVERALIRRAITEHPFRSVLPFRFLAAARHAPDFEPELEQAMFRAAATLPKLHGRTALLVDGSGSMEAPLSGRSELNRFDTAAALAMMLREIADDVDVTVFSTTPRSVPPRRGFGLGEVLRRAAEWGGTYTELAKRHADARGYDRIIIVTDEQSHQALSKPRGPGYVVNVASAKHGVGYGAWTHIDGWSENVVRYVVATEAQQA